MPPTLLITSFRTWKSQQPSNASDDLLAQVLANPSRKPSLLIHPLRQIPVDFQLAPTQVLHHVDTLQPDGIVLCGMAASRKLLNLESRAIAGNKIRATSVDLKRLRQGLRHTRISHHAGQFVCNGLYYAVLSHLRQRAIAIPCLFVHVPVLTPANTPLILQDFQTVLNRLVSLRSEIPSPLCTPEPERDTISLRSKCLSL